MTETAKIDNAEWLRGYRSFKAGDGCPWGSESARLGWVKAKEDAAHAASRAVPA